MKTSILSLILLFLATFVIKALAQTTDWLPVPYGQTSYFQDPVSMEIVPMETDTWISDSTGDVFSVYKDALTQEFGVCAASFWNPEFYFAPPKADFKAFEKEEEGFVIHGLLHEFLIPLTLQPGDETSFGEGFFIRYDQILLGNVLDTVDSIRQYTVLESDGMTPAGEISLSKKHGLTEFTPFRVYENYPENAGQLWSLIGYQSPSGAAGFSMPSKADYMPYTVGDNLVFQYVYYIPDYNGPALFEEVIEYHHLEVTSFDAGVYASISGICSKYNGQGFYIGTDNNYILSIDEDLDMLFEDMTIRPFGIPYDAGVLSVPQWFETSNSGVLAKFGGGEADYCNSEIAVDGEFFNCEFSTEYGLQLRHEGSVAEPPVIHRLYAADAAQFSYGTWPEWLAVDDHETDLGIKLYPNPATDLISIVHPNHHSGNVHIFSPEGRLVHSEVMLNTMTSLDISSLPTGQYIVHVIAGKDVVIKKLVKLH